MKRESVSKASLQNIESVAKQEQQFLERRTMLDRVADEVGSFTGSFSFVMIHVAAFTVRFLINTGHFLGVRRSDPYPVELLAMVVSVEAR